MACASLPVPTSQSVMSPPREGAPLPTASVLPSGLKLRAFTRSVMTEAASPVPSVRSSVHLGVRSFTSSVPLSAAQESWPSGFQASASLAFAFGTNFATGRPAFIAQTTDEPSACGSNTQR